MSPLRWLGAQFPTLLLARRNVSRASARSALAVAAVVIGVVAIGAIGAGGEAFKQDQLAAYEGFGGTATVTPVITSEDPDDRTLSAAEIDRLEGAATGASVLPIVSPGGSLVRTPAGETIITAQVKGIGNAATFYEADAGEIPANWRRTVIVGSRIATDNDVAPGDRITVAVGGQFSRSFRVAAVLEPQGFADPLNADQSVFVPLAQFETSEYDEALVHVDTRTGDIEAATAAIEREFNAREPTVRVRTVQEQREQFESFFGTINLFLVGVGAISLLVAAVTIANTMLMAAIEREGELGLLRAVGYPKRAVVSLLVAEATGLGILGAAVGTPLALGIGMAMNELLLADPLAFTEPALGYVGVGVAFGVVTAFLAGLYPAWRAAEKRPVEAFEG